MRAFALPMLFTVGVIAGCSESTKTANLPWTTAVDSTGDTVFVRVTGDVPTELVGSVEPELKVGAVDGAEELTFGSIQDVFPTRDGGLLVHDDQAQLIRFYDSTGAYVKTLGGKGGGPGEYQQVNGIAVQPSGEILVWDASGGRINRYTADGTFIAQFRLSLTTWFTSNALYADDNGGIYHWSPIGEDPDQPLRHRNGLLRVDTLGTVLDTIHFQDWGPAPARLEASSPDGRSRSVTTIPFQPSSYSILLRSGGLATGYSSSYRFVLQHPGQKPRVVLRDATPVPVSETERTERRAQIEQNFKRMVPTWSWTGPDVPTVKPAFTGIRVAMDGRIWVTVPSPAEPIPEAELAPVTPPPEGQPPRVRFTTRERTRYDVYSPQGELLGRILLPPRVRLMAIGTTHAWGTLRDADDVDYAVRFKLTGLAGETP
jgi:hypothetical protein